jgi:hypothetical protein
VDETKLELQLADGTYLTELSIFGILLRETGRVILSVPPNRGASTLVDLIEIHIPQALLRQSL